jgi:hypothetical protein
MKRRLARAKIIAVLLETMAWDEPEVFLKLSSYRAVNTSFLVCKNHSVNAV